MFPTLEHTFSGNSGPIYCAVTSGNNLWTGSGDKLVVGWNLQTGEQTNFVVKCDAAPFSLCLANNYLWIGLSNGDVHVIDVLEKKEVKFFKQHKNAIFSMHFLPSSSLVLTTDNTGLVCIWNNETFDLEMSLPLDCGKIRSISGNPDDSLIVLPSQNEEIRIIETKTFNEIVQLKGHSNGSNVAVFSNDEEHLYSVGKDGHLKIWDWATEKLVESYPIHQGSIYGLLIKNEMIITASRDKSIKLWDKQTMSIQHKITSKQKGHSHSINGLLPTQDGFLSYSDDHTSKSWVL